MEPLFRRTAILGLGLMGGSLGLDLRASGCATLVAGFDLGAGVAARALVVGAVDEAASSLARAVAGADLVVLATPVLSMRTLLDAIAPLLSPHALVTDLGSTKAQVVAWAEAALPEPERFVGGHPMTGSERAGIEAARRGLYAGATWCLTPTVNTDEAALDQLTALVRALGAQPLVLDASRHDWLVAGASHLPLVAAAALVRTLGESAEWEAVGALAAGGFRDTTRVASGDPTMARDILLTNAEAVAHWLDTYLEELTRLRERIRSSDPTLWNDFDAARSLREAWAHLKSSQQGATNGPSEIQSDDMKGVRE